MRASRRIAIAVAVLALLLFAAWGAMQAGWSKREIASLLGKKLGVEMKGLSGTLPFSLRIGSLAVKDAQGTWLVARSVAIGWSVGIAPFALHIHHLQAGHVQWLRLPEPEAKGGALASPRLEAENLSLPEVEIEPAVAGRHMTLAVAGNLQAAGTGVEFGLHGDIVQVEALPRIIDRLAGGHTVFNTQAQWDNGVFSMKSCRLKGEHATLEGEGLRIGEDLAGKVRLSIPQAQFLDGSLRGALTMQAVLDGALPAPLARVNAALESDGSKLALESQLMMEKDMLHVRDLSAGTAGLRLAGSLDYDRDGGLADGHLHLAADDLSGLNPFLMQPVKGSGSADILLAPAHGRQRMEAGGVFRNIAYGGNGAATLEAHFHADDLAALSGIDASVRAGDASVGDTVIDTVSADAAGSETKMRLTLNARAAGRKGWRLHTTGVLKAGWTDWQVTLSAFNGSFKQYPFALAAPAVIARKGEELAFPSLRLNVAQGSLRAHGSYSDARVDMALAPHLLPVALATNGREEGKLSGDIHVTGTPARPTAEFKLDATGLASSLRAREGFTLAASGTLSDELSLRMRIANIKGDLSASLRMPSQFSLSPWRLEIPPEGSVSGIIRANAQIGPLAALALPPEQALAGHAEGALKVDGTLASLSVTGRLAITQGKYHHLATGTALTHMRLRLEARGDRLDIAKGRAQAGRGSVALSGGIGLRPPYPLSLDATLKDADIVNYRQATGMVNGAVQLTGDLASPLLGGALTLGPMDIRLPEGRQVNVPQVQVRNPSVLPVQPWQKRMEAAPAPSVPGKMRLDLRIDAPSRVFVRGRGLDTELRGALTVGDTVEKPQIEGELHSVRGTYTLLERTLAITEGTLTFHGAIPPSPFMRLTAAVTTADLSASVNILGPVRAPKLTLTSTPPLPEDEILAYILFGRDVRSITPLQGIQLAQAIETLRGARGPGLDFLGKTRDLLGLNRLDVGQAEGGGAEVSAGKYIGNNLYIGGESGTQPGTGKATATFEVSPRFSVETEAGAEASGVRFNWKRDY